MRIIFRILLKIIDILHSVRNFFTWENLKKISGKLHLFVHRNSNELSLLLLSILLAISVVGFQHQSEKRADEFQKQATKLERQMEILQGQKENRDEAINELKRHIECLMTAQGVADPEERIEKCDNQYGTPVRNTSTANTGNDQQSGTQETQSNNRTSSPQSQNNDKNDNLPRGLLKVCRR